MGARLFLHQQASHCAPHSTSHAEQKRFTPDNITITQQLQHNKQNHIRNSAHDPQHHRHRHRHQLKAEMLHSLVLHIHVCALRYEEFNGQRITFVSCQMNWSFPVPTATSITSHPSLNIPRSTKALHTRQHHNHTAASRQMQ